MAMKFLIGGAGLAALAAAAPTSAQYYPPYAGAYGAPYGNAYGYYNNANAEQMAAQRCAAEVEARLHRGAGISGILGTLLGARTAPAGRVVSVTQVKSTNVSMRVRGLADSGRMAYNQAPYGSYGYGTYGGLGYGYAPQADLSFKCTVDYRGQVRDVDITRR